MRLPEFIQGVVCDLEGTLATYPPDCAEDSHPDYVPAVGAIDFLDLCLRRFGRGRVLVFTSADKERFSNAYKFALNNHQSIHRCLSGVIKMAYGNFELEAQKVHEILGFQKKQLAYVDDSVMACFNAIEFGFGFVVYLGDREKLFSDIRKQGGKIEEAVLQSYLDKGEIKMIENLSCVEG